MNLETLQLQLQLQSGLTAVDSADNKPRCQAWRMKLEFYKPKQRKGPDITTTTNTQTPPELKARHQAHISVASYYKL